MITVFLFVLSALFGVLIAVDRSMAAMRFAQIGLGLFAAWLLSAAPEAWPGAQSGGSKTPALRARLAAAFFAAAPALVALLFVYTDDLNTREGKLSALGPLMDGYARLGLARPPGGFSLNPNVAGGVIAAYFPLQFAALRSLGFGRRGAPHKLLACLLVALPAAALLISLSRSAWIGLAGAGLLTLAWHLIRRAGVARARLVWAGLVLAGLAVLALTAAYTGAGQRVLMAVVQERGPIWRDSVSMVRDYPYTGIGLSRFDLVYSSYFLLVHVPYLGYAHNLLLDIWLGQGLLGAAVSIAGVVGLCLSPARSEPGRNAEAGPVWRIAALCSVAVILIHGMLDDPFYGYGGAMLPLLFAPFGLLAALGRSWRRADRTAALAVAGALVTLGLATAVVPNLRARLLANLAALSQTQLEMQAYASGNWGLQDAMRTSGQVNLEPVMAQYAAALAMDPLQPTANRRLGQIEVSLGRYDEAFAHLTNAYQADPGQRAARQILGELYAVRGDAASARGLWSSIDMNAGQLDVRYNWYRYFVKNEQFALRIADAGKKD